MAISPDDQNVPQPVGQNAWLSAILAGVLLMLLIGISAEAYFRVIQLTEPEELGDRIEQAVREHYPELHEELVVQVKAQAPKVADQISEELIQSTPELRVKLEQFAARQLEKGIDEVTALSVEEFRKLLNRNRETYIAAFKEIEKAPESAQELVLETEADVEEILGADLQNQARRAVRLHRQFNEKLARVSNPHETLNAKELLERRILRILKTMQVQEAAVASTID